MHEQPHATFSIPSACAFGRTQPRVTPYCFYARSTPPRMRASLALPCSSLPDRRHATPQFFHPSIDTIPKKARHFLHPPFICAVHNRGLRHAGSAHVPHRRAPSYMVFACSSRLSQLTLICRSSYYYPALHAVVVFSVHLPSTTGGMRTLSEGGFVAGSQRCRRRKRAVGGVGVEGLFAD